MAVAPKTSANGGFLATIERVGNMVPHPAIIFFMLIGMVILLSMVFGLLGTTVTYEGYDPAVGDIVHVVPNHCCVVSNMVDEVYGVRGERVTLVFDTLERWDTPKILCATASEESAQARQLALTLGEVTRAAGFTPDNKPFRPHLTLARKVSRDLSVAMPQPLMPATLMHSDRFVLMESRRDASGSIYSAVDSWPLYD